MGVAALTTERCCMPSDISFQIMLPWEDDVPVLWIKRRALFADSQRHRGFFGHPVRAVG